MKLRADRVAMDGVVNPSNKVPVLVAVGDFASGVTSWAFRLRDAFADHPRYRIVLLNATDTGNRMGAYDLQAATGTRAHELLSAYDEAIVLPNFVWDLFPLCATLNAKGHRLHLVGFCRADSEKEYYAPLSWYAPVTSALATVSPACTEALAQRLDRSPHTIHTLPTGVCVPDSLARDYQTTPIRLAYGGRIVQEQKRVLDFIPLVEELYRRRVDFRFNIAGAGQQREALGSALAAIDPEGRVRLLPRRKPEAMAAFWADHDVFVQTSAFEGTSNSMLESMAVGTVPVLTETDSGVAGIVYPDENGFLVPVGDMSAMADAIERLATNRTLLTRMGHAAHGATKPYAMEHYVARFTHLLDAALGAPPGTWPDDHPVTPPTPFFGIRLTPDHTNPAADKRRIAILFPSPLRGGAEDYTLTVARGAVRAGYDVQGAFPNKHALRGLIQAYFDAGAFHHTLDICDVGAKAGQAPAHKRFTRTVRLLRRLKPSSVLFMLCGMQYGVLSLLGCAVLKVPTLVVFQLVRDDVRIPFVRRWIYRCLRARGQRYVAVSKANRALLARAFRMPEDAILVIPNGVDMTRLSFDDDRRTEARATIRAELGLPDTTRLCLTVGRLAHQKGHDILVPVLPHILAQFPDVHFLWAGTGPTEKALRRQLDTYGVAKHVTFLGQRDDIPDLLNGSDLFVHPARFEGQPFSLLEAMAAGLPIVSTTASGIREVVDHGTHGLLCQPDDVGALRATLLHALEHPEEMARMAEAASVRVADFSEDAMVTQTLSALDDLADSR